MNDVAWGVTDRVDGGEGLPPHRNGAEPVEYRDDEANLDELINEYSAVDADLRDEQERAQMAALATAPLRVVSSSPARLASALRGGTRAVGVVLSSVGAAGLATARAGAGVVGAARSRLAERAAARPTSHRASAAGPVRRPGRRLGIAALAALAVAAPAAATPAPWGSLVGASVGNGRQVLGGGIPDDLFSPNALGPLPAELPQRGLSSVVPALGTDGRSQGGGAGAGSRQVDPLHGPARLPEGRRSARAREPGLPPLLDVARRYREGRVEPRPRVERARRAHPGRRRAPRRSSVPSSTAACPGRRVWPTATTESSTGTPSSTARSGPCSSCRAHGRC